MDDPHRTETCSPHSRPAWIPACRALFAGLVACAACLPVPATAQGRDSVCYGTPGDGRLENGVRLPYLGENFIPYSALGVRFGRTYVHSRVERAVVDAYAALAGSMPDRIFMYGETGFAGGGRFEPHRTHRNGLSVDFMVPVLDADGRPVPLPADIGNRFGYDVEFDDEGRYRGLTIDFEALAEHLYALHAAAERHGIGIGLVIFEPVFLPKLYATRRGAFLERRIDFLPRPAWVRHDEHYHVDFAVPCRPL